MKNIRIAVQVKNARNSQGEEIIKVSVPMRLMFEKDFDSEWLNSELEKFEEKYTKLTASLKNISKQIKSAQGKGRVLLYWKFGDEALKFAKQNENEVLFLENVTRHLMRDVEVSDKMLTRCKKFRLKYPDVKSVNPNRTFDSYVSTFEGGYISAKRRQERETEQKHA
ncbi:hypothetical protein ES703_31809 [subsurface metagenome]